MTTGKDSFTRWFTGYETVITTNGTKFHNEPWVAFGSRIGKWWTGADDPGFQLKIAKNQSATNMYQREESRIIYAISARNRVTYRPGNGIRTVTTEHFGNGDVTAPSWDESVVSDLTNLAMSKLYGVLQEIANPVNGLEFLAEFRKTVQMVKNPAKALGDYLNKHLSKQVKLHTSHIARRNAILRNKRLSNKQRLRQLSREANRWGNLAARLRLEYKFGWEPLVKTVGAAAEAAFEAFPEEGAIRTFRRSSTRKVGITTNPIESGGHSSWYKMQIDEYEYKVTLVMRVRYDGQYDGMSSLEQLNARSGLLKTQLIPLAWELAPLSVFVDYFANVGDILAACMTETKSVASVDRYVSRRLLRRRTIDFRPNIYGPSDPTFARQGYVVAFTTKYTREKWTMSIPPLRFTTPADSMTQTMNLAAFVKLGFFY